MASFTHLSTLLITLFCLTSCSTSIKADEQNKSKSPSKMVELTLKDQFDQAQKIDQSTKVVIFAHDMTGNDIVEEALEQYNGEQLAKMNTVFLADISGMPSLIGKLFALPAMRKRAYPIMLDREGTLVENFIAKEQQVTVMYLDNLVITDTKLVAKGSELSSLLKAVSK